MKNNQKGFTIVELLIIIVALALLGFVGWNVYSRSSHTQNSSSAGNEKPNALLYANFDGLTMKLNSYSLTSGGKNQILEQSVSEPDTRSSAASGLDAKISTDKQLVAYRFGDSGKVKVIKSDGAALGDIARSNINSFSWLYGKKQLVLEVSSSNAVDCNGANCEAPINGSASDWYLYDVDSSKETRLDIGDNTFNSLEGQIGSTLYFAANSPYGGISPKLYAYNVGNHKVSTVNLPGGDGIQVGFISSSPNGERAVLSILPSGYGVDYRCTIYELQGSKLGKKLVDEANYQCESAYWTDNNEFYFDKSTGPSGTISTSNNSASGYYVLLSVYSYNFSNGQQKKVLVSDGSEVYRLLGSLPDGSFVVSNEANKRTPLYKMEVRNADGSLKSTVEASDKEMLLVGSSK